VMNKGKTRINVLDYISKTLHIKTPKSNFTLNSFFLCFNKSPNKYKSSKE